MTPEAKPPSGKLVEVSEPQTDAERREIELEENLRRKDLTAFERSKHTTLLAEAAKEAEAEKKKELSANSADNSRGRGRPKDPTSREAISERIGIPEATIRAAEAHVAAAERYPILEKPGWSQVAAMKAAGEEAEKGFGRSPAETSKKGGRPSESDSSRAVEERPGIPRATIQDAEAHVAAAPALLDVDEVARMLSCSPRHVRRLADRGALPRGVRLGRLLRWRREEVEVWIQQGCPNSRASFRQRP